MSTIDYVTPEEAISRPGLRMVVMGGIPSPWSEAAKGILHIKQIPWAAVRLAYDSKPLKEWTGQRSAPVAMYNNEPARAGWAEILLLAERIAPSSGAPALVPHDAAERALMFGLAHEICGEQGLGWARRLQLVHAGLRGEGGFAAQAAGYVGRKYGYSAEEGARAPGRVVELLGMLAARLRAQRAVGSDYFIGDEVTALDVYSATFMALFRPLGEEVCAMDARTRAAFEFREEATDAALDEGLLGHRGMMYQRHLALPLAL